MAEAKAQTWDMDERLRFLGMGPEHRQALAEAGHILGDMLPQAVDRFYDRLASWGNMMRMFDDPSRRKYARDKQVEHWKRLFTGRFDQEYLQSVRKIGRTHSRIGLEPQWFLGAYAQILGDLQTACVASFLSAKKVDAERNQALGVLLRAISQATTLDMDLVISVYLEENRILHQQNLDALSETFRSAVGESIANASTDLQAAAHQIRTSAIETVSRSEDVDTAARNANLSVQSMAAAMEEMSRSIAEIRIQTERSAKVSEDAVGLTRGIDKVMVGLSEAVGRIDVSVEQINDIAARTNILAINASIEAARAGVVGRGFAVVASEVRSLASQTVGATESIGAQISALKTASRESVGAVQKIVSVIQEIDRYTATIALAIDEQGVVTREIAGNAQTAAEGSVTVSENIAVVARSAGETGKVAEGLETVLGKMDDDLRKLNDKVNQFLLELK